MSKNEWLMACLASALVGYAVALEVLKRQQAAANTNADPLAWLGAWSAQ